MTATVAVSHDETSADEPSDDAGRRAERSDDAATAGERCDDAGDAAKVSDVTGAPRPGARAARLDDVGMATAEYAIATVAAAGFAGLLLVILRSNEVRGLLLGIIRGALSV